MSIANTRIAGFVGITQKGPMNEPTRLGNWDEFLEIFGYSQDSYTSDSVYGFFKNGGTDCWVVRVAHNPPRGELADDRPRVVRRARPARRLEQADAQDPRAQRGHAGATRSGSRCVHAPGRPRC